MASRKYWSAKDISRFKKYLKNKADVLIPIFYQNIKEGMIKVRKPNGFFKKMGEYLGRTALQCKSKFQKFEKDVYSKYLGIPEEDYLVFQLIQNDETFRSQIKKIALQNWEMLKLSAKEKSNQNHEMINQIKENFSNIEDEYPNKCFQPKRKQNKSDLNNEEAGSTNEDPQTDIDPVKLWQRVVRKIQDNERNHVSPNKIAGNE